MPSSISRVFPALSLALILLSACQTTGNYKDTQEKAEQLRKEGKTKEAIQAYTLVVKEMEQTHAGQAKELVAMNKLVTLLLKDKQIKEADNLGQRGLSMAERLYGPEHANVLPQLALLEKVAEAIPDKERHREYLKRMVDIQAKATGEESPPVMWLLDAYVRSASAACGVKFEPARLRLLVRLRDKYVGPNDVETLRDKMILADCLAQNGPNKESLEIYENCLSTARAHCKALLPELLLRYGKTLKTQKQNARAVAVLKEAFAICGPGPHYHPVYASEISSELGYLLEEMKRKKEAAAVYSVMLQPLKESGNEARLEYFKAHLEACQ